MAPWKFEVASIADAERAADLFLEGKKVDRTVAVNLFREEFQKCATFPEKYSYLLVSGPTSLVAYAGARFYNPEQDENMYQTTQLLPMGWYLRGLKVHPDYRRAGIARKITQQRLSWLADKTKIVFVFLEDEQKVTIPMYESLGFKKISQGWEFLDYKYKRPDQKGVLLKLG